jgi:sterol 3beta-glucosyltransferase
MRIDILALGSQGDVRPNVALGIGLRRAGHRVRVVTLDGFEELIRANNLDYLAIGGSQRDIAQTAAGGEWIEHRAGAVGFLRGFVRVASSMLESGLSHYWAACQDVDALVATPMGLLVAMHVAERLRVPLVRVSFVPTHHEWADRKFLRAVLQGLRLFFWGTLRPATNAARRKILALRPLPISDPFAALDREQVPTFDAYSPAVVPTGPGWEQWIHVTGYWFLDDPPGWVPPAELLDFLESGSPPVCVGFGSTPFPRPEAATDLVVKALARAGRRAVVLAGGSGLAKGRLTDDVLSVDFVPHGWLFPRVAAAVHHGGAGVAGAALRAGLPSVVVPVFADQPFWGRRVSELGAGPEPIPVKRLSIEALAAAIHRATTDESIRSRAADIGRTIRAENGVARAVEVFEQYVASRTDVSPVSTRRSASSAAGRGHEASICHEHREAR